MSDFGADVFDQDRPKGPKHHAPPDDRPALPAPMTKALVHATSPIANQTAAPPSALPKAAMPKSGPPQRGLPTGAPQTVLPETIHRAEAAASSPPAPFAHAQRARPAREPDERDVEPAGSRWRDEPKRIPSVPPRRDLPAHHGHSADRRTDPGHTPQRHTQHKERHTEFRSTHESGEVRAPREHAAREREPVRLIERNTPRPASAPETVGLLVDLEGLQAEARTQQGELAMHRLRSGLGNGRAVAKALAIAKNAGAAPSGFDLIVASGGFAAGVQFASAALELLRVAPVLVMAPTSDPIRKLASALRAAGHTVELAGFSATEAAARRLGRDCLFVP